MEKSDQAQEEEEEARKKLLEESQQQEEKDLSEGNLSSEDPVEKKTIK